MNIPNQQNQYQLFKQAQGFSLNLIEGAAVRAPGPKEVLVRVRASSLNRRDIMVLRGWYPVGDRSTVIPLSDGAGEIVAVGAGVTRVKIGDRVVAQFFQTWLDGRPTASTGASALGGAQDGMLSEYVTLNEEGVLHFPEHLSFEEAATLPCAALTAWNGLVTRGGLRTGDHILLQGTGGVSIFGLQLAVAHGAKAIITSSSDTKLTRAKILSTTASRPSGLPSCARQQAELEFIMCSKSAELAPWRNRSLRSRTGVISPSSVGSPDSAAKYPLQL